MAELENILKFIHQSEKLKNELRHSWTSSGRQESVAEHCWRTSLMIILLAPKLEESINLEKALKMAIFMTFRKYMPEMCQRLRNKEKLMF